MSKIISDIEEFQNAVTNFMTCFELVFDNDWTMTKNCIKDSKFLIEKKGTFLNPKVDDEENNWANRGSLLATYRELYDLMKKQDISTSNYSQ